ncbi:MAG: inosine/xanthosine triphosphatase [Methanomassiliicoccales archaeon]|nr:inosine/xanthosine triphosphatase [Methanomassiliicoccales archaeon]
MKVGVGGTFNVLHRGHRRLLETALASGDELAIGLMSDEYCHEHKVTVMPYEQRERTLIEHLASKKAKFTIVPLETREGTAPNDRYLDVLVVSEETHMLGARINDLRLGKGLAPTKVIVVPYVLADDFRPISSSRVLSGEIDIEGKLLRPLKVRVGSLNPVKVAAVREVLQRFHPQVEIVAVDVHTSVNEQPWGRESEAGALARAQESLGDGDLGVGIEAGVWEREDGLYDVQYCAIVDGMGRTSIGHGMGFRYPPSIAERVRQGSSVGRACGELFEEGDQGSGIGAIGILTKGALDRKTLTEQAVLAAMVPRIKKDLYW